MLHHKSIEPCSGQGKTELRKFFTAVLEPLFVFLY